MNEPFRWTNCFADVASARHGQIARAFFDDVVTAALHTMDAQIALLASSDDVGDEFARSDAEDLLQVTTKAFCLSLQGLWERQLRGYLRGCAKELGRGVAVEKRAMREPWEKLDALFMDLRGLPLTAFVAFPDLDFLQTLGNACRHGEGPATQRLLVEHLELWLPGEPPFSTWPDPFPDLTSGPADAPSFENAIVSRDLLESLTNAVVLFWDEAGYIYTESLQRKHPRVEKELMTLRPLWADRRVTARNAGR